MPTEATQLLGEERREAIVRLLLSEGKVRAAELALQFGVSLDTVRRDLAELAGAGLLRRVHGGALPLTAPGPPDFSARAGLDLEAKAAVAKASVPLLVAGEVVALSGGSTLLELALALPDDLEATFVVTSPDIALALADRPGIAVDVVGGRLDPRSRTLTGPEAIDALRRVRPDSALLSACTIHPEGGLTLRHRDEAAVVRAVAESARRVIALATADKLGTVGPYPVAAVEQVDVLVTDAPEEDCALYREAGLEVVRP
jgi:DeoR/GlpR family transcriptional regulator of sugar metabolism